MRPAARAYIAQADARLLEAMRAAFRQGEGEGSRQGGRRDSTTPSQRALIARWVSETVWRGWPRIVREDPKAARGRRLAMELVTPHEWACRHLPDWIPCPLRCDLSVDTERLLRAHLVDYHDTDPDEPVAVEIPDEP